MKKFISVKPNYRKNTLEIIIDKPKKTYHLPFSVFIDLSIGVDNRFKRLEIMKDLDSSAIEFELENGVYGDFPVDFVLYHCEPTYDYSPINQLKRLLKKKLDAAKLSKRVMADALKTSPAQVMRLLEADYVPRQLAQILELARLAGYELRFSIKPISKKFEIMA